ncbi:MAG: adenine deaminase [Lachnospiraceae bacterium]
MNKQLDEQNLRVHQIDCAAGRKKAQLVLKHASVVNVFTNTLEQQDIAIDHGYIVGLGEYQGVQEVDLAGRIVCPGFLDGHIHLESSMVAPGEFAKAVLPHGTTAVITDPHEIANVAGCQGIDFMLEATKNLGLDVYIMLPSCVPATELDEAGAVLEADDLKTYYQNGRILGLAEMMNSYGTVRADSGILEKIDDAQMAGGVVDGHAPLLSGKDLNAYVLAGVQSDHECSQYEEALEKIKRGQWIMVRQGTAAKNLEALLPLFQEPFYQRCMLATDDKHPGDLRRGGHMDFIIREAVKGGADPFHAIRMATLHTAEYFGLKDRGAVAPGYLADLVVLSDLASFQVEQVYKAGILTVEEGKLLPEIQKEFGNPWTKRWPRVTNSFYMDPITEDDLSLTGEAGMSQRVIRLTPGELLTVEEIVPWSQQDGLAPGVDLEHDIVKMAVLERHGKSGNIGLGYLKGYGLKEGAVASSVAHDSHNLILVGTNDADMILAGNRVRELNGGLVVVKQGKILGELPLPIAGLMSLQTVERTDEVLERLKEFLYQMGVPREIDPFMTLSFASLPVIPAIRLNTYGVVDVGRQRIMPPVF